MGIVLPDSVLGNPRDANVRKWLLDRADVVAVVDCPTATFMPHTGTKTSVLVVRKHKKNVKPKPKSIPFFAIAEHCGHTMRGTEIRDDKGNLREDFSAIARNYKMSDTNKGHLGFTASAIRNKILIPGYYDPRILNDIRRLEREGDTKLTELGELERQGRIEIKGAEATVKSEDYDLHGTVRFIRTADISAYELNDNPQKMVSEETYELYKDKQKLRKHDILFVKDGDNKIGETAILLEDEDLKILVQSHFKIIRSLEIDPFLLLWLLSTDIVKRQIRQRVFIQSTLGTIGERIKELRLPFPVNKRDWKRIGSEMKSLVESRRNGLRQIRTSFGRQ